MSEPTPPSSSGAPEAATPPPAGPSPSPDPARSWNTACHAAALSGLFTGVGFLLGPLIVWLIKKADYPSVDAHGKESLNFQISAVIYHLALVALGFVTCGMAWWLTIPLAVMQVILVVVASLKVSNGESYRYPLTIRLIN